MTSQATARTSTNNVNFARTRHYIGTADVSELRLVFQAYFVDTVGEVDGASGYTIRANVEYNGMSKRVYFGGQRDGFVPAGAAFYQSDSLLPSEFGLSVFPAGAQLWIRAEREYAVGGLPLFHQTVAYTTSITDERYVSGGAGLTTSQLDNVGLVTAGSGGWTAQTHIWLPLCIIGKPVTKMISVGIVGASIENGVGDNTGDGLNGGGGYVRRSLANVGGAKIARISLAKSGETAKVFVGSYAKRAAALAYVTHGLAGYGGNDYSTGETWANTLPRLRQTWAILKAAGVPHVSQFSLHPKTDSSDGWTTVANQTPRAGYSLSGDWFGTGNSTMAADVATDANLDGFIDIRSAQVDATFQDKWRLDLGVPVIDGTHPTAVLAAAMATANATHMSALKAAYQA
ncbi:hypothetical protein GOC13_24390 [Sinorhizobium meliloti]|nr:hypothetical protein [Sinorhizobium meliloti]